MMETARRNTLSTGAFLSLGFRPFFLGASVFAVVQVAAWTLIYTFSLSLPMNGVSPFKWHAHEMVYGYALAVIAGFLLTAAANWTGRRTVHGLPLLLLFSLWAAARIAMLAGGDLVAVAAFLDVLFLAALAAAVADPIIRVRAWRQAGILSKLILLGTGAVMFALGVSGLLAPGVHWAVYGGLYLVVGLILTMGRRVIPLFIERGVGYPVALFNARWLDISSLVLFLAFFVLEVFLGGGAAARFLAAGVFAVNCIRLVGWHTPGIWRKPLLWGLYLGFAFVVAGFGLLAVSGFASVSRFVALHALAYGGIGLITLSMMARVSLGHTGRDVHDPPRAVARAQSLLVAGTVFRVLVPILLPTHYATWVAVSQGLWIAAFALLAVMLAPMLLTPRADAPGE